MGCGTIVAAEQSACFRRGGRVLRVLTALRESTGPIHDRVEGLLDLLSPDLDAARLGEVIARFHAFWSGVELYVDEWAERSPALATELDWPRRRRSMVLAADLRALARTGPEFPACPVVRPRTDAEVLGWLYVSEGSTLGGAVLARHLAPRGLAVRSFTPYDEGPGPMWRTFIAVVESWTAGDLQRVGAVVAGARASFAALADWLAPLELRAAAVEAIA